MKHKSFMKILALVLVLVLSIGVLTACGDKNKNKNTTTQEQEGQKTQDTDKTVYLSDEKARNGFITTMFSSANKIADGISVDTSAGKNVALNVGLTLTISKDSKSIPIKIYVKGFIDREHVTVDKGVYTMTDANKTEVDVAINAQGIDSIRAYLKMNDEGNDGANVLYLTIAGNNVKVDLTSLGKINGEQSVEDYLFNLVESLLQNDVVASIADAFSGESFDLNKVISGLIMSLVDTGDQTIADIVLKKDSYGKLSTIGTIVAQIFGGEDKVTENLGETINVENILKTVGSMIFSDPVWIINGRQYTTTKSKDQYDTYVRYHANEEMTASVKIGGTIIDSFLGSSPLKNAISIGFTKGAGTSAEDLGKMEEFFIDLNLNNILGDDKTLGIKIAITDLKMGSTKDVAGLATPDDTKYETGFTFDMGFDLTSDNDIVNIIVNELDKDFEDLEIKVGGDKLSIVGHTVTVPEKLQLNIAGTLDLFNSENTALILEILAQDSTGETPTMDTVLKAQVYGDNDDLVADIKASDEYNTFISDLLQIIFDYKSKGKNLEIYDGFGPLDIKKDGDKWVCLVDTSKEDVGEVLSDFFSTGILRIEGLNLATIINGLIEGDRIYTSTDSFGSATADFEEDSKDAFKANFDFIFSSLTENKTGIIATLYNIINITDNSLEIGGEDIISTLASTLYKIKESASTNPFKTYYGKYYNSSYVGIGALMEIFGGEEGLKVLSGNDVNFIDAYNSFEQGSVWVLCSGFNLGNTSRTLCLTRGSAEQTAVEKALATYNASKGTDSTALNTITNYGYVVVKDTEGAYVTYPKVLMAYYKYLVANDKTDAKDKANAILKENNIQYDATTKVYTVTSSKDLLASLESKLVGKTCDSWESGSYYMDDGEIRFILQCLLRIGVQATPYINAEGNWVVDTQAVLVDDAILNKADLTAKIYTEKSAGKATRGGVKVELTFLEKDFTLDLYMNFDSKKGNEASSKIVKSAEEFYGEGNVPDEALKINVEAR